MYQKEFDFYLQKHTPRATLLYGESHFLIELYAKKIIAKIPDCEAINAFYYADYKSDEVLNLLSQSSLFGDNTIVLIKTDKKIPKKELQSFLKALEYNPSNFLIIEFYQGDSRSIGEYGKDFKEMAGVFKGEGLVEVRFFELQAKEAQAFLAQKAKEMGLQIEIPALQMLLEMQHNDLGIALKEMEKLAIHQSFITQAEVKRLCSDFGCVEVDDLLESLMQRKEAIEVFVRLEEEGVDEIALIAELNQYFYRLFLFYTYFRNHGKSDAKEILGYVPPRQVLERISREAISLKEVQYQGIFEVLLEWRIKAMSGKGKTSNSLVALNKLQRILREF